AVTCCCYHDNNSPPRLDWAAGDSSTHAAVTCCCYGDNNSPMRLNWAAADRPKQAALTLVTTNQHRATPIERCMTAARTYRWMTMATALNSRYRAFTTCRWGMRIKSQEHDNAA